jgi:hypothetical protein
LHWSDPRCRRPGPKPTSSVGRDSLNVTLSWHADTDELIVCVYDERRDVYFEIQPARDFALDVYHHPYAYVGCRADGLAA